MDGQSIQNKNNKRLVGEDKCFIWGMMQKLVSKLTS